ncbi:MAG TPA: type II toxin-antitoxin system HigB family toxin [Pyrinomonadaceae bacterium]|nr:type II toxin-antitoxin system HigB family toxin [Pyrinomonadaceae bacterium]
MNVISFKTLREFASSHKDASVPLRAWYTVVRGASWQNLADVKKVYPAADLVGRYTVFNIKGNKYRLIARIVYRSQTVFIIGVLTHEEYDLGKWKE